MTITVESVISRYIKLRDQKAAIEAKVKEETKVLDTKMQTIEAWLKEQAEAQGVSSFKTAAGTAFVNNTDFANVSDWDATLAFIREGEHYDMLERRVNKSAVRAFIDEHKEPVPGVNYGQLQKMSIRRPTTKGEDL